MLPAFIGKCLCTPAAAFFANWMRSQTRTHHTHKQLERATEFGKLIFYGLRNVYAININLFMKIVPRWRVFVSLHSLPGLRVGHFHGSRQKRKRKCKQLCGKVKQQRRNFVFFFSCFEQHRQRRQAFVCCCFSISNFIRSILFQNEKYGVRPTKNDCSPE